MCIFMRHIVGKNILKSDESKNNDNNKNTMGNLNQLPFNQWNVIGSPCAFFGYWPGNCCHTLNDQHVHPSDVKRAWLRLRSPRTWLFVQKLLNTKTALLAFLRESTCDWWFPSQRASNAENVSMPWRHYMAIENVFEKAVCVWKPCLLMFTNDLL